MRRRLVVIAALALLVGACDAIPFLPRSNGLLVSIEMAGGECPGGVCSSHVDIYRDGRVVRSNGQAQQLDVATLGRLVSSIEGADWDAILARPFTGQCPTAYDGTEVTYTFRTRDGPVVVASCRVRIDPGQEPFSTLAGALSRVDG